MQSFELLKKKHGDSNRIPYAELLLTKEWSERRKVILDRDNQKCTECGTSPTSDYYDKANKTSHYYWFGDEKTIYAIDKEGKRRIVDTYVPITSADKSYSLHVHHKLYVLGRQPWEYENDDLITMCNWCHWALHQNTTVPVYRSLEDKILEQLTPCSRCNGAGIFPEFSHIQSGVCFRCEGRKFEELINSPQNYL